MEPLGLLLISNTFLLVLLALVLGFIAKKPSIERAPVMEDLYNIKRQITEPISV